MLKRFAHLFISLMVLLSMFMASPQAAGGSTFEASGSLNISNRLLFEPIIQNSKSPNSISVSFSTPRNMISNATQLVGGHQHKCALLEDKTIECWGPGTSGQLGNGSNAGSLIPVKVSGISTATQISAGDSFACALLEDRTIKCWGDGYLGRLGNGSEVNQSFPVSVTGVTAAIQISSGYAHSCALLEDKTIKCWGNGGYGQLGNEWPEVDSSPPISVSRVTNAIQVSAGAEHTCALLADKSITCWGRGEFGQLGNGLGIDSSMPVAVTGISSAIQVSSSQRHTCALLEDKSIKCWGYGIDGQLGNSAGTNRTTPVSVSGISDARQVVAGNTHSCAILEDATVKCWGEGAYGMLGNGSNLGSAIPVSVIGISNATQVSPGEWHTCALLEDKSIKCWGYGRTGSLGNGSKSDSSVPVIVSGALASVERYKVEWSSDGTNWQNIETTDNSANITGLSPATSYQMRLSAYVGVSWSEPSSVVTMRTTNPPSAPFGLFQSQVNLTSVEITWFSPDADGLSVDNYRVEWTTDGVTWKSQETTNTSATITGLSGGTTYQVRVSAHSIAGWGESSQVITATTTARPIAPVGVYQTTKNSTTVAFQVLMSGDIIGIKDAIQLDGSTSYRTCALLEDKTIKCWNSIGNTAISISGISSARQISQGAEHTCALLENKAIKCWGGNLYNQLGNTTGVFSHTPVVVQGIANATQVTAGSTHTCALLEDKSIKCWGANPYGNLGDGTNVNSSSPVSVIGITNATQVTAGSTHTCALLEDKSIKCWGRGVYGILGNGTGESSFSPISVTGITNATHVSAGHESTCALLGDKSIKCWGYGGYGILGDDSTSSRATPVSVLGVTNASAITVGHWHACALLEDKTVKCWGRASSGQLGIGQVAYGYARSPYKAVSGISSAVQVAAGSGQTCALLEGGSIKCWGDGLYELPGSGLEIEKWRIEWSSNGTTWQNSEIQDKSASLTRLSGATSYQLRIKSYTQAGYSDFSEVFHVSTSGTRSMRFNFKLTDGRPLTGGAVSWALNDESYSSATNYGVPSTGVLDFPRVAAGTGTITVSNLQSPTGELISFTKEIELGQSIHNVVVPLATGQGSYRINVKLPNGEPVLGAAVSVSGLDSYKAVDEIAYSLPSASSGSTNDQGTFLASGFVSGTPRAKVTYNDGVLVQTKFVDLTSETTNVVLDEMPWLEVNESAQTVSSGSLVSVPVSLKGVSSKSGYSLSITAPSGSSQTCKGRVLTAKTNSSGKATLKVCANKSGTYKVKAKGAVSTGVVQLKVKNAAPLPVTGVTARSTSLGSATVAWSAPSYTGGASITGYKVIITGGGKTYTKTTTARSHTFTGLKNATQYTVTVEAITKYGSSSRVTVRVGVA